MSAHVLVVDDDEQIRRSIAAALTRAGFAVSMADDAEPAIALAGTNTYDILVVDFNMKTQLTGADVVRHYKQQHGAQIFCVVLSGEDGDVARATCEAAGVDRMLLKPCSPTQLRRLLSDAMQARAAA